jgi:serine/threonine-protein phosphatase 2A regulatory subunit B
VPTQWVSIQSLGEQQVENIFAADIITAIKFSNCGQFIAIGDEGGRVILFNKNEIKNSRYFDYQYLTEVQAHEMHLDQLRNVILSERINQVAFLNESSDK